MVAKFVLGVIGISGASGLSAQSTDVQKQAAEQKQLMHFEMRTDAVPLDLPVSLAAESAVVSGAPYSADAVTERVQVLPDGNRIVQTTSSAVARDGQGRQRRDESFPTANLGNKSDGPKLAFIDDPVNGVHWTLDSRMKVAMKIPQPKRLSVNGGGTLPPASLERTWLYSSGTPGSPISIQTLAKRKAEEDASVNRMDLGTQSIEGVRSQGTRVTRTVGTGSVGNEQPFNIVTETWYSPELKVLILSKSEDPRIGTTTYRLTNVQRGEPSPDLFEVPSDFTVKDQPGDVFIYRQTKKEE